MISLWYKMQRGIDLQILWPACKKHALDTDRAKAAFALHCFLDPAWLYLGEEEIYRRIDELR